MKHLSVVVAGSGQIRDVQIQPGTTAGDILHQLNLPDYLLSKGPNEPFFAAAESVYDKVKDGEKIFASTKADVGGLPQCTQRTSAPGLPPLPSASSFRGWRGGTAPLLSSSGARFPTGRNAAGRTRATPTSAAIKPRTGHFRDRSRSTVAGTSISGCICPRTKSAATAIGCVSSTAATTGTSSTWPGCPRMSARES